MKITLDSGQFGWDYLITAEDGRDLLIQSDFEYPGIASTFGWRPCHSSTDGTVDCPECKRSAADLILDAQEYLDEHIGDTVDDPGYFDGE